MFPRGGQCRTFCGKRATGAAGGGHSRTGSWEVSRSLRKTCHWASSHGPAASHCEGAHVGQSAFAHRPTARAPTGTLRSGGGAYCERSQRGHGQRKGSQCDPCQCAGSHRPRRPPGKPATRVVANAQAATAVRRRARAPTAGVQGHPLRDCALREATGLGGLPLRPLPVGYCAVGALPSSVGEVPVRSFACRGRIQKKYRPPGSVVTSASKSCSLAAELCLLV